jgi:hypothetical protein
MRALGLGTLSVMDELELIDESLRFSRLVLAAVPFGLAAWGAVAFALITALT